MRFEFALSFTISVFFIISCQKFSPEIAISQNSFEEEKYLYEFSVGLSKAVANSEEIRSFIKRKAHEMIDRDYDVFYAFVKDEKINDSTTFKHALVRYFTDEETLNEIERQLPLLTIFVPDLSWIKAGGFSPDLWDTSSPEIVTTYMYDKVCKYVFYDGQFLTELEGAIPACASVIVKNNERIGYKQSTKGSAPEYFFISEEFDGTKDLLKTKYMHSFTPETYYINEPEDGSDIISFQDMNVYFPEAATAYELFKGNSYACQRDYVCYGMTSSNSIGKLKLNIQDKLVRFKINPNSLSVIADDQFGNSNETNYRSFYAIDDNGDNNFDFSDSTMINRLWGDGNLEFYFQVNSGNGIANLYVISVLLKDCFTVNAKVDYWHNTWVKWYRDWEVSYDTSTGIKAKWIYPSGNLLMPKFDLGQDGRSSYSIQISEHDSGAEIQQSKSFSHNQTTATSTKIGYDVSIDSSYAVKYELGYSESDTQNESESLSVKWYQNDDNLGLVSIYYHYPYISGSNTVTQEYTTSPIDTGSIIFTIMPVVLW